MAHPTDSGSGVREPGSTSSEDNEHGYAIVLYDYNTRDGAELSLKENEIVQTLTTIGKYSYFVQRVSRALQLSDAPINKLPMTA